MNRDRRWTSLARRLGMKSEYSWKEYLVRYWIAASVGFAGHYVLLLSGFYSALTRRPNYYDGPLAGLSILMLLTFGLYMVHLGRYTEPMQAAKKLGTPLGADAVAAMCVFSALWMPWLTLMITLVPSAF